MSNILFHFPASVRALDNDKNSYHLNYERHQWRSRYYVLGCMLSQTWLAVKAKKAELLYDNRPLGQATEFRQMTWRPATSEIWRTVVWYVQFTGVSKKPIASLPAFLLDTFFLLALTLITLPPFRTNRLPKEGYILAWLLPSAHPSTLKMEAGSLSETSANFYTISRLERPSSLSESINRNTYLCGKTSSFGGLE